MSEKIIYGGSIAAALAAITITSSLGITHTGLEQAIVGMVVGVAVGWLLTKART